LNNSIFNQYIGGKTIELVNPIIIIGTLNARLYCIPSGLEIIHAYHPDYKKLIEFNLKISLESFKETKTFKSKLLIKQKGMCGICNESLLNFQGEFLFDGSTHIHHINKRVNGGDNTLNILILVHSQCHNDISCFIS